MYLLAFERIAADQLAETIGLVRRRAFLGAHLVQDDLRARFGGLIGSFAPGKPRADNLDTIQNSILESFAIFAEDFPQALGNFADRSENAAALENMRHQVFGSARGIFKPC